MPRYLIISVLLLALVFAAPAFAGNAPIGGGGSCSGQTITDPVASTQGQQQAFDDGLYTCQGGTSWVPEAFIVGGVDQSNSAPSCNSTNAGMLEWTGSVFQGCNGSAWSSLGSGGSSALSGLLAATTTNSINNSNYAQTWTWNSLAGNTALALTTTDLTSGTILEVENTGGNNSTGYAGYFENITTGAGYALYGLTTGSSNSGYGVYGIDNASGGYGVYGSSSSGYGVYSNGAAYVSGNITITGSCIGCSYDLAMFYPGTLGASAFARVVSARAATYPTSLTGSYCVAKEGATSSTTININQIHAGTSTNRGTVVFGSGGGTNVTNCTFAAASGISLAAGDAVEFAFPASPDATLGDVAITLQGTHQ